jgi:hypothetical protein
VLETVAAIAETANKSENRPATQYFFSGNIKICFDSHDHLPKHKLPTIE